MKESQWLTEATGRIAFGPDRRAVRAELFDHIEEAREALRARHPEMTPLETEERAVVSMGDPEPLSRELARLHRPWMGYLWRVSQVLAGVVIRQLTNKYVQEGPLPYLRELAAWDVGEILPPEKETLAGPATLSQSGKVRAGDYAISSPEVVLVTVKPGGTFFLGAEAPEGAGPSMWS